MLDTNQSLLIGYMWVSYSLLVLHIFNINHILLQYIWSFTGENLSDKCFINEEQQSKYTYNIYLFLKYIVDMWIYDWCARGDKFCKKNSVVYMYISGFFFSFIFLRVLFRWWTLEHILFNIIVGPFISLISIHISCWLYKTDSCFCLLQRLVSACLKHRIALIKTSNYNDVWCTCF